MLPVRASTSSTRQGTLIGTAISDAQGVAQIAWIIGVGTNTAIATGRGIAAQNNYPGGTVKPFMPDISLPTNQQSPVALRHGQSAIHRVRRSAGPGHRQHRRRSCRSHVRRLCDVRRHGP